MFLEPSCPRNIHFHILVRLHTDLFLHDFLGLCVTPRAPQESHGTFAFAASSSNNGFSSDGTTQLNLGDKLHLLVSLMGG